MADDSVEVDGDERKLVTQFFSQNILTNLFGIAQRKVGCNCLVNILKYVAASHLKMNDTTSISKKCLSVDI